MSRQPGPSASQLVARLTRPAERADRLNHVELLPARAAVTAAWPSWTPTALVDCLRARGVERPWSHQVEAAEAARLGRHVVVATGTASGKSLAFWLPALGSVLEQRRPRGRPGGHRAVPLPDEGARAGPVGRPPRPGRAGAGGDHAGR